MARSIRIEFPGGLLSRHGPRQPKGSDFKDNMDRSRLVETEKEELLKARGSDPRKIALAQLLWRRMTVSQVWLAERLAMRSAANVSQILRRATRAKKDPKLPKRLAAFADAQWLNNDVSTFAH